MKYLKYILFLLLIAIIGAAIYIAVQPNEFSVTRVRTIKAPASIIYNNVNDFKNWEAWSSWVEKDPNTVITLPENTSGIGGSYSWEDKDGIGTMKTIETVANESIKQQMQFADFPPSDVHWSFKPNEDGSTEVTWNIAGYNLPFKFKMFSVLMGGMEKQIGPHFEHGLEKLDGIVTESMKVYSININGLTEYGGGFYLYKTINASSSNISDIMGQQYGSIVSFMVQNNIAFNGMPFTIYQDMNLENQTVIMSNAMPVNDKVNISGDTDILCGYIPKTPVLKATLKGNYTYLSEAWKKVMAHVAENNLVQSELKPFEIYTTDPGDFPNPADWITEIYIPIEE